MSLDLDNGDRGEAQRSALIAERVTRRMQRIQTYFLQTGIPISSDREGMAFRVARFELGGLFALLFLSLSISLFAGPAYSRDGDPPETVSVEAEPAAEKSGTFDGWGFAVAFEASLLGHTGKANTDGTPLTGPRVANPSEGFDLPDTVVSPVASREEINSALIGANLEVMTPALSDSRWAPRLFMDVTIAEPLTSEVGLALQSDPGIFAFPTAEPAAAVNESAIIGRGTKTTVQHQGPQFHAGLGTAFEVQLFETERIRIKPSIVYSRVPVDVYGVVHRPVRLNNDGGSALSLEEDYRFIALSQKQREVYHGIGPALEIEYDTGARIGPFDFSLYLKGHASHLLGDLKTRFSQTNPDPASPNETVNFKYSQDRWIFRGGTGIRMRFAPKSLGRGRR